MKTRLGKYVLLAFLVLVALPAYAVAGKDRPTPSSMPTSTPTPTIQPSPSPSPSPTAVTKDEALVITLINQRRAKHQLAPVKLNTKLMAASRAHSAEMATRLYFAHNSYNGESFFKRLEGFGYTQAGYRLWMVGENIAWGTGLLSSPVAIVDGWMNSPPHRAVILTPEFREIGVGDTMCTKTWKGMANVTFFTLDLGRRSK